MHRHAALTLVCACAVVFSWFADGAGVARPSVIQLPHAHSQAQSVDYNTSSYRVKVELFVRSLDTDAQYCEDVISKVLADFHPLVHVVTHYFASLNETGEIYCKNGERECVGNMQQLCVHKWAGAHNENYEKFWKFIQCQNEQVARIGTPELLSECLDRIAIDTYDRYRIVDCYHLEEGQYLTQRSAMEGILLGIDTCCSIYMNRVPRCIYTGGAWQECEEGSEVKDFQKTICKLYEKKTEKKHHLCADI